MSTTIQAVVDLARIPLNDALKVRFTDQALLTFYNSAMFRTYELRPDLMIGGFNTPYTAVAIGGIGGNIPIADRFTQTLADYISARAEMKDDEMVNSGRADVHMKRFVEELLG
jgi:hypothetical protein